MKLLFDQNLSYRLVGALTEVFPGSAHVRLLGMERADDETIWHFAKANGFTIVTQDSDFNERSLLFGYPPKVIWLKCGNASTDRVLEYSTVIPRLLLLLSRSLTRAVWNCYSRLRLWFVPSD